MLQVIRGVLADNSETVLAHLKESLGRANVVSLPLMSASGLASRLDILVKVFKDPYLSNPCVDYFILALYLDIGLKFIESLITQQNSVTLRSRPWAFIRDGPYVVRQAIVYTHL